MISGSWWKSMDNVLTYVLCGVMIILVITIIAGGGDY